MRQTERTPSGEYFARRSSLCYTAKRGRASARTRAFRECACARLRSSSRASSPRFRKTANLRRGSGPKSKRRSAPRVDPLATPASDITRYGSETPRMQPGLLVERIGVRCLVRPSLLFAVFFRTLKLSRSFVWMSTVFPGPYKRPYFREKKEEEEDDEEKE